MYKVKKIIEKNFDSRLDAVVIAYLMDIGIEKAKKITEDDIAEVEGNGLMTAEFLQAAVRTCSIIARECNLFDDILPYIAERFESRELSYDRLMEIARWSMLCIRDDTEKDFEEFLFEVGIDEEEMEVIL